MGRLPAHLTIPTTPLAAPSAQVVGDHYRITVLTPRLLRLEYSSTGVFEDRATQVVLDRDFPTPEFTVAHKGELGRGKLNTFLAFNYSKTRVTGVKTPASLAGFEDVLLSERERLFIEQGGPRMKATLGFDHALGPWETSLKVIHFGSQTLGTFSGTAAGVPNARYAPKTSADLALTYAFDKNTKITIGGNNIFNVKPSRQDPNETDNGFIYDSVQFGLNGASYFIRFWKKF